MRLTGTTTPDQSGPGSKGNEGVLLLQNWSLTTRYSLMLYSGYHFSVCMGVGGLTPLQKIQLAYSKPNQQTKDKIRREKKMNK